MRSGTVSLPLAASLAQATEEALAKQKENETKAKALHDALLSSLTELDVTLNSPIDGSPYVVNFSLNHHKASVIVEALSQKGIYVSTASACSSRLNAVSPVLSAMGIAPDLAGNAIRVSFDESNSLEEVKTFTDTLSRLLKEVHQR